MPDTNFDALLRNWMVVRLGDHPDAPSTLIGQIAADSKGRFPDGRWIMTSLVLPHSREVSSGEIVQTRNTRYLLSDPID